MVKAPTPYISDTQRDLLSIEAIRAPMLAIYNAHCKTNFVREGLLSVDERTQTREKLHPMLLKAHLQFPCIYIPIIAVRQALLRRGTQKNIFEINEHMSHSFMAHRGAGHFGVP